MKFLKKFESNQLDNLQDIENLIEDVCQEVFDKYFMQEIPKSSVVSVFLDEDESDMIFYHIDTWKDKVILRIVTDHLDRYDDFVKCCQEIRERLPRLRKYGLTYTSEVNKLQNPYNFGYVQNLSVEVRIDNKLKKFESFEKIPIEDELSLFLRSEPIFVGTNDWIITRNVSRQTGGTDFFVKRELEFFRNLFSQPSDKHDFFRVSGTKVSGFTREGEPVSGERRSTFKFRYMPKKNKENPIKVTITRYKDDYYLVKVECMVHSESRYSNYNQYGQLKSVLYLIDNFEDLQEFLTKIDQVHYIINGINQSHQIKEHNDTRRII